MNKSTTPTTTATAQLDEQILTAIDDDAADRHLTNPEDVREVALEYVDRVELVTEAGEPVGEVLARDPRE